MKIEKLDESAVVDFIEYCKKYRKVVDDSNLYDEDLNNFKPNSENPTYVIRTEDKKTVGAVSLMVDDYMRRGKKGRFRIFHSEDSHIESWRQLLQAVLLHTEGLDNLVHFIPTSNMMMIKAMESLSFTIERYSFLLTRDDEKVSTFSLPEGYEFRSFRQCRDEEAWCRVRNVAFATLRGSETPATPEMITKMILSEDYLEGGMIMLYHNGIPIGIVRGSKDDYEGSPIMNIGPLAIVPEYQGKGLGRCLLRTILNFSKEQGYRESILCVNAENERAKALYLQEGFKQVEAVACYKYDLKHL